MKSVRQAGVEQRAYEKCKAGQSFDWRVTLHLMDLEQLSVT